MRYQTITQAFKEIVESHKAGIRFFTGLESEAVTDNNENYPLVVLVPTDFTLSLDNSLKDNNKTWNIELQVQELLSDQSTVQEKNEALDRTGEYLKDIVLQFVTVYGDDYDVTYGNITETLDFVTESQPAFVPFIDEGDGVTGWQVTFSIKEGVNQDMCHLPDMFN